MVSLHDTGRAFIVTSPPRYLASNDALRAAAGSGKTQRYMALHQEIAVNFLGDAELAPQPASPTGEGSPPLGTTSGPRSTMRQRILLTVPPAKALVILAGLLALFSWGAGGWSLASLPTWPASRQRSELPQGEDSLEDGGVAVQPVAPLPMATPLPPPASPPTDEETESEPLVTKCNTEESKLLTSLSDVDLTDLLQHANDCAIANVRLGWGISFDHDGFVGCLYSYWDALSTKCYECFLDDAQYSANHCKGPCIFSWCAPACLECVHGHHKQVAYCMGLETALAPPTC